MCKHGSGFYCLTCAGKEPVDTPLSKPQDRVRFIRKGKGRILGYEANRPLQDSTLPRFQGIRRDKPFLSPPTRDELRKSVLRMALLDAWDF